MRAFELDLPLMSDLGERVARGAPLSFSALMDQPVVQPDPAVPTPPPRLPQLVLDKLPVLLSMLEAPALEGSLAQVQSSITLHGQCANACNGLKRPPKASMASYDCSDFRVAMIGVSPLKEPTSSVFLNEPPTMPAVASWAGHASSRHPIVLTDGLWAFALRAADICIAGWHDASSNVSGSLSARHLPARSMNKKLQQCRWTSARMPASCNTTRQHRSSQWSLKLLQSEGSVSLPPVCANLSDIGPDFDGFVARCHHFSVTCR